MTPHARLAVTILVDDRGWLLLQERDENAPRAANQWGLVGGHVEEREHVDDAARRELLEETGVDLGTDGLRLWCRESFTYSDGHRGDYAVYWARVSLSDEDIIVGEGRRIVFCDPQLFANLDAAESCAYFVPRFLESAAYQQG